VNWQIERLELTSTSQNNPVEDKAPGRGPPRTGYQKDDSKGRRAKLGHVGI